MTLSYVRLVLCRWYKDIQHLMSASTCKWQQRDMLLSIPSRKLLLRTVLAKFCWWILMKWVVLFGTAWISTLNSKPVLLVIPFSWNGKELLVKDSMELDISDPLHSPILATITSIVSLSSCQPCAFNCPLLQLSSGCNKTKVVRKFLQPMDLWVNPFCTQWFSPMVRFWFHEGKGQYNHQITIEILRQRKVENNANDSICSQKLLNLSWT